MSRDYTARLIEHTKIRKPCGDSRGELLAEMEKNKGARSQSHPKTGGSTKRPPVDPAPKLSDLDLDRATQDRELQDDELNAVAGGIIAVLIGLLLSDARPSTPPPPASK